MSDNQPKIGTVSWFDLTVENADELRDFYSAVIGWIPEPLSMGEYNDYVMKSPDGNQAVAGVCHARGMNQGIPPQWILYFNVADLAKSVTEILKRGGKKLTEIKEYQGGAKYCFVQDPAGAAFALFQPGTDVK